METLLPVHAYLRNLTICRILKADKTPSKMARTFMALYLRLFSGLSEQFLTIITNNLLNFKKEMSILKWAYGLDKN